MMRKVNISDIKQMGENLPFSPTGNVFLDDRYNNHIRQYGVNNEWKYYRFFWGLAARYQPEVVVELGGYQGTSAAHFKGGHPEANVFSIDHHTDPGDDFNREKMNEAVKVTGIVYLRGWTIDSVADEERGRHNLGDATSVYGLLCQMLGNRTIDILFIDSWHDYDHAMRDWVAYKPLLSNPALVICDDITWDDGAVISGMGKFWEELPGEKYLDLDNLHPGTGMGFLIYRGE